MKYSQNEFLGSIMAHIVELKEFEKEMRKRVKKGEPLNEMTELFAEFVEKFSDKDKEVAYILFFMMGVNIVRPKTIFEDITALCKGRGASNKN